MIYSYISRGRVNGGGRRPGFPLNHFVMQFSSYYHHLRHLCFERMNLGQKFLICSELEEHHCPQPWSFLSFKIGFLHPGQVLFISSLKNSTAKPQLGQTISKMESKPHSSVLFPEHLLIVIPCFTFYVCRKHILCITGPSSDYAVSG